MSKEKTKTEEETFACTDCGLHYRTKNLAEACEEACKAGACDAEITAQAIERTEKDDVAAGLAPALAEMEAKWKRALADYQNLVKEMSAERARMRKDALRDVVERLLPIVDNFSAALEHAPSMSSRPAPAGAGSVAQGEMDPKVKSWITGVGFIRKQMEDMLSEFGVTKIETVGKPFDAALMEAVGEEAVVAGLAPAVPAPKSGTVLRETMAGFKLGETIIRPAKVITVK